MLSRLVFLSASAAENKLHFSGRMYEKKYSESPSSVLSFEDTFADLHFQKAFKL